MPQPDTWQYYLLNEDDTPKSYNYDDDLVINTDPVPLENTPDGWQDQLINWARNVKYFGIFRSYTPPLRFVTEGKRVLRNLFYNNGIEKVVNLLIKKLNNAWTYDDYYEGEINFSKFSDENDYCTVNVMEGGLAKLLKANEGTAYEIPIGITSDSIVNETVPVVMDGIDFKSSKTYITPEGSILNIAFTMGLQFANEEGTSIAILTRSSPLQDTSGFDYTTNDDRWILDSEEETVVFNYKQTILFNISNDGFVHLYLQINTGATIDLVPGAFLPFGDYSYNVDVNFTLAPKEKVFVMGQKGGVPTLSFKTSEAIITFNSSALPTTIYTLPAETAYKKLVKKMTADVFQGESDFLAGRTDLVLTSGDAIRGLPGSVLKTTFTDFYKWSYTALNLALGYEASKAKLEGLAYFFNNAVDAEIANLGEVSDFTRSVAEDLFFNSIKVGYADQKYDDVNGKDEFNSTQVYKIPIIRIVKEWDLISPYRADSYGTEFTRANLTQKTTTDSGSDNDVFVLQIEQFDLIDPQTIDVDFSTPGFGGSGSLVLHYLTPADVVMGAKISFTGTSLNNSTFTITALTQTTTTTIISTKEPTASETVNCTVHFIGNRPKRGPYDTTPTGLISPLSVFNIELSPHRNLLAHGNYIRSICDLMDTKNVTFQSALKNAELISSVGGVSITEKSDILIGDLDAKLFKPYYFTFKTQVPIDLVELMKTKSRGYFTFTWQGYTYKGFPIDINIKPADNDVQEFKLLCCPDVDLATLI